MMVRKFRFLLNEFVEGRTIVLLDGFEALAEPDPVGALAFEMAEALHALLEAPPHGIKVILTAYTMP
jgi:hypothetical protein